MAKKAIVKPPPPKYARSDDPLGEVSSILALGIIRLRLKAAANASDQMIGERLPRLPNVNARMCSVSDSAD